MKKLFILCVTLATIGFSSCENEPVELLNISTDNIIEVNSELYSMLQGIAGDPSQNEIGCIDFIYAFTLYIFDENLEVIGAEVISNDMEFSDFLGSLPPENSISMSYPITSTLANGEEFIITNNAELKEAIDLCVKDEVLGYCNGLLEECIWRVAHVDGGNNDFEGAYFDVSNIGAAGFYFEDTVYNGTWVTFFIEDELHLNINLDDDGTVAENWNHDWMVNIVDEDHMELTNGTRFFLIEKECAPTCQLFAFETCELDAGSGIGVFPLDSYTECILPFVDIDDPGTVTVTFHVTQEDAIAGDNPIESPYTNIANPQFIFVRVVDNISGEVYLLSILIRAVPCEI